MREEVRKVEQMLEELLSEATEELVDKLTEATEATEAKHTKFEFDLISWAKNEDEEVDNIYAKFQMLREHDNLTKKQQIAILMQQIVFKEMAEQLGKKLTHTLMEESYPKYCKITEV
jgi:malonyl CoA-acyl carrier protein transacylase